MLMSKEKALFTLTISPVKTFVGNGRKMKDLYAGSAILSQLTKVAMDYIEEESDLKLITPVNEDKLSSFPNCLVARTEDFHKIEHLKMATSLSERIKDKFYTICDESLDLIEDKKARSWAKKQLESFLEIYWVFEPYVDSTEKRKSYATIRQNLFNNLEAVKRIRPFNQTDELWGRKCILHPEYNALFYRKEAGDIPANLNTAYALDLIPDPDDPVPAFEYLIKENEALSAIAFVKRFYVGPEPSIVSMRDMVFRKRLELTPGKDNWYQENVESLREERDSHQSGFISCVINAIYDKYPKQVPSPQEKNETAIKAAIKIVDKMNEEIPELDLKSYYALLKFDGDSMGDRYKELSNPEEHLRLSEKICQFAREARKMIEKVGGVCIFAGGEDVLAALPLEEIWSMLKKLHEKFGEIVDLENQPIFTFSAGVVIPHLMEPLKNVMNQIDEAETYAKDYKKGIPDEEKNAFSVMLMKRGGEHRQIRYSFQKDDQSYQSLEIFKQLIIECESQEHSKSFFSNSIQLLEKLPQNVEYEMIESLIKSVMKNQRLGDPEKLLCYIKQLYDKSEDVINFINTLDIVRFLTSPAIIHNGGDV